MTSPRVSVWISTRNAEDYVAKCIDSLRDQTFRDWEAVFLDDASTDGTFTAATIAAASDPRIRLRLNTTRIRQVGAYLQILPMLYGDIVVELDGDDWFPNDTSLERIVALYADPLVDAAAGRNVIDGSNISGDIPSEVLDVGGDFWRRLLYSYAPRSWRRSLALRAVSELSWAYYDANGQPWQFAGDVAMWAPIAYLARRIATTDLPSYWVNRDNPVSDWRLDEKAQIDCARAIRAKWQAFTPSGEIVNHFENWARDRIAQLDGA